MEIRYSAVSGTFYPADKNELKRMIGRFLASAKEVEVTGEIKGLVVPHAGYVYSGVVAAAGYCLIRGQDMRKIILLGPSHYVGFGGAALSSADFFETPLGAVKLIKPKKITSPLLYLDEAHLYEHSLEVHIPFLQIVLKDFQLLPICLGNVVARELADVLISEIDEKTLVVASSDLSHFHSYEEASKIDATANDVIPNLKISEAEEKLDACGKSAILTLMYIAKKLNWKGKFIDYKNSGHVTGERGRVVGYGCYGFVESKI